mmetsp:Transcript_19284/g.60625  ORF Transcript_19284/g.60625 Transcript_19284/m.60625 type:complete len:282 (-) Transcript_19284:332-1177(-)
MPRSPVVLPARPVPEHGHVQRGDRPKQGGTGRQQGKDARVPPEDAGGALRQGHGSARLHLQLRGGGRDHAGRARGHSRLQRLLERVLHSVRQQSGAGGAARGHGVRAQQGVRLAPGQGHWHELLGRQARRGEVHLAYGRGPQAVQDEVPAVRGEPGRAGLRVRHVLQRRVPLEGEPYGLAAIEVLAGPDAVGRLSCIPASTEMRHSCMRCHPPFLSTRGESKGRKSGIKKSPFEQALCVRVPLCKHRAFFERAGRHRIRHFDTDLERWVEEPESDTTAAKG